MNVLTTDDPSAVLLTDGLPVCPPGSAGGPEGHSGLPESHRGPPSSQGDHLPGRAAAPGGGQPAV